MANRIVDDGTGSGQSPKKKYTFSFELTKPQHTHFWEWLTTPLADVILFG